MRRSRLEDATHLVCKAVPVPSGDASAEPGPGGGGIGCARTVKFCQALLRGLPLVSQARPMLPSRGRMRASPA